MPVDWGNIALLCFLTGLAGFIDSIAGGGGLISLPAYLLVGLPAHQAAGSNKFSAGVGLSMAVARFGLEGKIMWREALVSMFAALAGGVVGSLLAMYLSATVLKLVIVGMLPLVGIYLLLHGIPREGRGKDSAPALSGRQRAFISLGIGLSVGAYDGLVGPGTGTFVIIASVAWLHIDLLRATANAKVINLASNISSLAVFLWNDAVVFRYALPAAASTFLGNYLGVSYCMKYGPGGIRKILFVVLMLLFAKLIFDLLGAGNDWQKILGLG
jgi:uncharacterized membrane protein YfcA